MIRVSIVCVLVCYLCYGQQGQKDKAHDGNRRQKAMPRAVFAVEVRLKSFQSIDLVSPPYCTNLCVHVGKLDAEVRVEVATQ